MAASRAESLVVRAALLLALALAAPDASAINASDRYRSPRNPERRVRASTELIVLHTTEAPARSSLNKVSDRGECHFVVTEDGSVYRIVDRDREAFHAGRSMWNGREDVDKFSVGIECVGYHDKPMSDVQLGAIRTLVKELQAMYRIPDERVVCHSHVAYGAPNRWHRQRHRGRKRCGMLFAMPSVRAKLGLRAKPARDNDVLARRLVNADEYLRKVLYGNVDTMRGRTAPAPSGGFFGWLGFGSSGGATTAAGAKKSNKPATTSGGTKPQKQVVKPQKQVVKTQKKPVAKPAKRVPKTVADLGAMGYVPKGVVGKAKSAAKIAGKRWNAPDTYYVIRGRVTSGAAINAAHIEIGTVVWMKR